MEVQGAGQNAPLSGKASETPATVWEEMGPLTYKLSLHFSVRGTEVRRALISAETEGFRLDCTLHQLLLVGAVSKAPLKFK